MKLIHLTLLLLLGTLGSARAAGGPLHANLEAQTNQPGRFVLHISNVSSNVVRLLDVAEGSGFCGDLYEVTVEKDGKRSSSQGACFYAPGIDPTVVEIRPGQTYDREIQPVSYVLAAERATAEQLTVTYRVSQRVRESYIWIRELGADLSLTFTAQNTSGTVANDLLKAIEGNWSVWRQTNVVLSITPINLTIITGGTQEVWVFVPSTNRFGVFASRNGVTNQVSFAHGGAFDKAILLGDRRWFVNRVKADPANGGQPSFSGTNQF